MELLEFTGKTYDEALLEMKNRLGDKAVVFNHNVLEEKRFFGLFSKKIYKIFAFKSAPKEEKKILKEQNISEQIKQKNNVNSVMEIVNKLKEKKSPKLNKPENKISEEQQTKIKVIEEHISDFKFNIDKLTKLSENISVEEKKVTLKDKFYNKLIESDYEKSMLKEIFSKIKKGSTPLTLNQLKKKVISNIKNNIQINNKFKVDKTKKPYFIIFSGTTGEGKTSTLIKMAYKWIVFENKKIGIINMDTSRVGADAQLDSCIAMIGNKSNIKKGKVSSATEFENIIEKYLDCDIVLIDTAGRNQKNSSEIKELENIKEYLKDYEYENILVINSIKKFRDMNSIFKKFDVLNISRVIFSMVDTTTSYGPLLSLLYHYQVPIAYLTNGKNIEDDLVKPKLNSLFTEIASIKIEKEKVV